ncbi:hypothetical protein DFP72DRAFT_379913 [Ephemerocybe angulata]|uniref:Essential protein Yae1 N-terminal domain-containing protein n=1 Tax=Ephemerocybe angulata TaxID=980116 RepID=A0A8H6HYP8_9AGAR|nr:hypothetical protein DFP72DRAFT_379913 [Tulosesus angulatus]
MDEFDSLVNLEQTFYDEGYKDGYAHGRIHGLIEGRELGREKGYEMWEELGYYEGFAGTWRAMLALQGNMDGRATKHIDGLLELIGQFPLINPSVAQAEGGQDLDILKLLRQIRSKHKLLCATLGVRPRVHSADASEGGEEAPGQAATPLSGGAAKKGPVWEVQSSTQSEEGAGRQREPQNQMLSF